MLASNTISEDFDPKKIRSSTWINLFGTIVAPYLEKILKICNLVPSKDVVKNLIESHIFLWKNKLDKKSWIYVKWSLGLGGGLEVSWLRGPGFDNFSWEPANLWNFGVRADLKRSQNGGNNWS